MRLLLITYALKPDAGSEPFVGWQAVEALSRRHRVTVVTRPDNREAIETVIGNLSGPHGPPDVLYHGARQTGKHTTISGRFTVWRSYSEWMRTLPVFLGNVADLRDYDLIHHITYVSWRPPSLAWSLDLPFVWGPIGGGEGFPLTHLRELSPKAAMYELLRLAQNAFMRGRRPFRECANKASHVFVCNPETDRLVRSARDRAGGVSSLPATYLKQSWLDQLGAATDKPDSGPLRCFAGGSIEGRKGIALAIKAVAHAVRRGVDITYEVGGVGPERESLERLSERLGLVGRVTFPGYLRGSAYREALHRAHVYLLPSLRDNSPVTLMEAMAAGCVPVVARIGGPAQFVDESRGVRLPPDRRLIDSLTDALVSLAERPGHRRQLGRAARGHAVAQFSEAGYVRDIEAVYGRVVGGDPSGGHSIS